LKDEPDEVSVMLWVKTYHTAFRFEKTLILKSADPILYIDEVLTNQADEETDLMWGHHLFCGC
jgi:hypothetical protein